jgi:hypothetical protein
MRRAKAKAKTKAKDAIAAAVAAAVLLGPACVLTEHSDGIAVEVVLTHLPARADAWPAGVTLDQAFVSVTGVEIVRCAGDPEAAGSWKWTSVAYAHTSGTPTRLGVPAVEDLLAPAAPRSLGVLHAPPGRYCGVRLTLGPADADALGLEAAPGMLDKSALLDGSLHSVCDREQIVEVTLAAPVEVSEDALEAQLVLRMDASALFDGVDPGDEAGAACAAAANVARSIR